MGIFNKKGKNDDFLESYSVQYRGGHPEMLAKGLITQVPIKLEIYKDYFTLKPTLLSKQYFEEDTIQYKGIYDVKYSDRSNGLTDGDQPFKTIIHIDYNDNNFGRIEMRFEMRFEIRFENRQPQNNVHTWFIVVVSIIANRSMRILNLFFISILYW